jgi:hypothetical protein
LGVAERTTDEASELFDDLYGFYKEEPEESYFLGSIVLIKEEGKPLSEVIDGQQRLTTLTILIAAIASKLNGELRSQFLKYIKEPGNEFEGLEAKPRISLREKDQEFFAKYIQDLKITELLSLDSATFNSEAQSNILINTRLILDRLQNKITDAGILRSFASFIVQRCYLVAVSTPSQKSAFRVFSVLNDRGLDLLPSDIIKADIIGEIPDPQKDEYTECWEDIEVQAGRDAFNDLFAHIRMIYAKYKARRSLLYEFRDHVLSQLNSPKDFIDNILVPYAEAYNMAKKQAYISTTNADAINMYLKWLNRIDNSDWLPPAILFMTQQKNDPEYMLWFFQKLERLAAYLHICAKNINQRIERYAELLRDVEKAHSFASPPDSIDLTDAEKKEMIEAINGNVYKLTARRRNYLILRLDSFLSDGAATYDPKVLTIEHVLPQTVSEGSDWLTAWPDDKERENWKDRIANLVPLTQPRNSKAHNYDFSTKKNAYFGGKKGVSSYVLTTQVLNTESWTPQVVSERQKQLLEVLIQNWELDNVLIRTK